VIFTLPALIILGTWSSFSYVETTLIAGFGGILGVHFTIPLRRALIIDQPLRFPGVATAEVLKVGAQGGGGVGVLVIAGVVGAVAKTRRDRLQAVGRGRRVRRLHWWWHRRAGEGRRSDQGWFAAVLRINASPALLSVGYIVGFNVATVIFAGAALNRWVAMPLFAAFVTRHDHRDPTPTPPRR
jgi:putative OPT family oligopeptide transporter